MKKAYLRILIERAVRSRFEFDCIEFEIAEHTISVIKMRSVHSGGESENYTSKYSLIKHCNLPAFLILLFCVREGKKKDLKVDI